MCAISGSCQDLNRVHALMEKLGSKQLHGRGYVKKGDKKAALYLARQMKQAGLQALGGHYFQNLNFPMNTLPGKLEIQIGGKSLIAGVDFLVSAASPAAKGTYALAWIPDEIALDSVSLTRWFKRDLRRQFVVGPANYHPVLSELVKQAAGWIIRTDQPMVWRVSNGRQLAANPEIRIKVNRLPVGTTTLYVNLDSRYYPAYPTQNVCGFIQGRSRPGTFLVFTAHYDHLGRMGRNCYFPGGNDNASGVAMVLELARYYARPENQPEVSMAFLLFCGEEAGLLGASHFVNHPLMSLDSIAFVTNLDMVGTGSQGIKVVNGAVLQKPFHRLLELNTSKGYLRKVSARGAAANSDHYPFSQAGVPAFFIYTLGQEYLEYHTVADRPEQVPLTEFADLYRLLIDFSNSLIEAPLPAD